MLAPFTAGWQTTDVNPLIIEKSEVLSMSVVSTIISYNRMDNKREDMYILL